MEEFLMTTSFLKKNNNKIFINNGFSLFDYIFYNGLL
jgi:hypothetical protein